MVNRFLSMNHKIQNSKRSPVVFTLAETETEPTNQPASFYVFCVPSLEFKPHSNSVECFVVNFN